MATSIYQLSAFFARKGIATNGNKKQKIFKIRTNSFILQYLAPVGEDLVVKLLKNAQLNYL